MQVVNNETRSKRNIRAVHVLGSATLSQSASHVEDLLRLEDFAGETSRIEIVIFLCIHKSKSKLDAQD